MSLEPVKNNNPIQKDNIVFTILRDKIPSGEQLISCFRDLNASHIEAACNAERRLKPNDLRDFIQFDLKTLKAADKFLVGIIYDDLHLTEEQSMEHSLLLIGISLVFNHALVYKESLLLREQLTLETSHLGYTNQEIQLSLKEEIDTFSTVLREHSEYSTRREEFVVNSRTLAQHRDCIGIGLKGAVFLSERDGKRCAIKLPVHDSLPPDDVKALLLHQGIPETTKLYAVGPPKGVGFPIL